MTPKIFGREPAAIAAAIEATLATAFAFGLLSLIGITSQDDLAVLLGVAIAVLNLYVAWSTRATLLGVVVGLVKALLMLAVVYQVPISPEQAAALIAFVSVVVGLFQRTQTTPIPRGDFNLTT